MRLWFLRLLIVLTALGTPLQAAAALVMPLCQHALAGQDGNHHGHAHGHAEQAPVAGAMLHCQHDAATADESAAAASLVASSAESESESESEGVTACQGCGLCHLAGTAVLPLSGAVAPGAFLVRSFAPLAEPQRASHIPEHPLRPPSRMA